MMLGQKFIKTLSSTIKASTKFLTYISVATLLSAMISACSQAPAEYVDNGSKVYKRSGEVGISIPTSIPRSQSRSYDVPSNDRDARIDSDSTNDYDNHDYIDEVDRSGNSDNYEYFDEEFGVDSSGNFALSNPMGNSRFVWPLDGKVIKHYNKNSGVEGINISAALNTPVRASSNGRVIYVGNDLSEYGKLIIVKHDNDLLTAYAHLDGFMINKGDLVERGQIIGTVGKSGDVNSPQLHFSIRKDDKTINPEVVM